MKRDIQHILIADDNPNIREILIPMLEMWLDIQGFQAELHEVSNGAEALAWVKAHGIPDLLLLDVRIPIMNGAEFLRQVALMEQDIRQQTLILTGYADDLDEHLGTDALLLAHLRKPFLAPELFAKLDALLL
jgi:CheY-like chemotaxis protein